MSVNVSCSTKDIRAGMKHLRAALPKKKDQYRLSRIELDIRPNRLTLSTVGASYHLTCTANCFAKVILPAVMIDEFVRTAQAETFTFECREGEIAFAGSVLSSNAIIMVHPENQSTIELTINYKAVDLLRLRRSNDVEELSRMSLLDSVLMAENDLMHHIYGAFALLGEYGVSEEDLRLLVQSRIHKEG